MKPKAFLPMLFLCGSIAFADENSSWLDLQGGGHAVGPAQTLKIKNPDGTETLRYGRLENGTLLPASGEGFVRLNSPATSWGTGMTISLLENATAFYFKTYSPENKIYIASIAQEKGGPYGPHSSHQNGLDADVLFMGQTKYETVLDEKGQVSDKFNPQWNWNFWRLLMDQKLMVSGQSKSVVYMIFVAPVIKDYICQWARKKNLLQDPESMELLRRLRPTAGHDTHFHIRLRCSPYYVDCYQQGEPAEDPGCP